MADNLGTMASKPKATSLNISLPESMKSFIDAQVVREHHSSASEYVRTLVREAQKREAGQQKLEALLLEGLDSGSAEEVTPEYWRRQREDLEAFIAKRRSGKRPAD
jgi:antitoxin ParD1/3/4